MYINYLEFFYKENCLFYTFCLLLISYITCIGILFLKLDCDPIRPLYILWFRLFWLWSSEATLVFHAPPNIPCPSHFLYLWPCKVLCLGFCFLYPQFYSQPWLLSPDSLFWKLHLEIDLRAVCVHCSWNVAVSRSYQWAWLGYIFSAC